MAQVNQVQSVEEDQEAMLDNVDPNILDHISSNVTAPLRLEVYLRSYDQEPSATGRCLR